MPEDNEKLIVLYGSVRRTLQKGYLTLKMLESLPYRYNRIDLLSQYRMYGKKKYKSTVAKEVKATP
jgi:hypothetical protein